MTLAPFGLGSFHENENENESESLGVGVCNKLIAVDKLAQRALTD